MNLHEYQSKIILASEGLKVLPGGLAYTPGEVEALADRLARETSSSVCVVKAQVHAGGRGKGGGVKVCKDSTEARKVAEEILGMQLVTPQTSEEGKLVSKVYVEAGCRITSEFYLSFLVDRKLGAITIIASSEGGMDIEEVAHNTPEKIFKVCIDPKTTLHRFQCATLAQNLGLSTKLGRSLTKLLENLYRVFVKYDLDLMEINPLVLTESNEFVILDAKCSIDDNALFRHPRLRSMNDYDEMDSKDIEAFKLGLSYVALDGNIGCLVNGAGLAMATMDIIKANGGSPANFLDVGGSASRETVKAAFKIILSDPKVKGILVNIFGGIMRCDIIAQGVIDAAKELKIDVPLVVRLQGSNVDAGREILSKSDLEIIPADTMDEAANKIVSAITN